MKKTAALILCLVLSLTAALSESALTVNSRDISIGEADAWMWLVKQSFADTVCYYRRTLGVDYWSLKYSNGQSVWDSIKADAFKQLVMISLFCDVAAEEGISLSQADKSECYDAACACEECDSFTKDDLDAVLKMRMLAGKAYSLRLSRVEIDEEGVTACVDKSAYISYEASYVFVPYYVYALDGDVRASCVSMLKGLKSFEGSFEDAARLSPNLIAGTLILCLADCQSDVRLLDAVSKLSVGETSEITETDYGLFLLRLIDNSDESLYEAAVNEELLAARKRAYREEYNRLYLSAEYGINAEYWDSLAP